MDLGLRERVYLVTGASRGLGLATAAELAAEGARLIISARDPDAIAGAAARLREASGGDTVQGVRADNADPATAARLTSLALERYGRLDGALISVGGPPAGSVMQTSDEVWQDAFDAVFLGALRLARQCARAIMDGPAAGGSLLLVLSSSVRSPIGGLAVSNGLRPGLAMAAKTLADELGPHGIRVNGLLPGRIATDRLRELDAAGGDEAGSRARHEATIPLRRYGTPAEFGRVATFLLSPAASYLSGVMLSVDGGALRTI